MRVSPILTVLSAGVFGFFIGISFPVAITPKVQCVKYFSAANSSFSDSNILGRVWAPFRDSTLRPSISPNNTSEIHVSKSEERLPPGIKVSESDLHLRRLWGAPSEDAATRKYLLALAVGYNERINVNATVQKFSNNFDIIMFHYDGDTTEWDEFEWSRKAVHVSGRKQTKWWFAKRFMHPRIVAPYEYIFLWDEDLGVEDFTAEEYVKIVRKHGLDISQPGLDATRGNKTYDVSVKRNGSDMHRTNAGEPGRCPDVHQRPCSGFVEVMAPVFSKDAWRCAWHMIQNDLVHGWGLDFNFFRCVDNPEEQIGVVDALFVVHHGVPTLIGQGTGEQKASSAKVRARQWAELGIFRNRISKADRELANSTAMLLDRHQP